MSWEATAWARRAMKKLGTDVKPVHRLLLVLLGDTADEEGLSWPSVKTLASECGCSERSIQRNIDTLVAIGLIEKMERRALSGRQQSNLYRLKMDAELPTETPKSEGDNLAPIPRQNDTPIIPPCEGDKLTPIGVTKCRGEGDKAMSPLEQSCEPTLSLTAQAEVVLQMAPVSAHFDSQPMFWDWEPDSEIVIPALARSAIPVPVAEQLALDAELVGNFRNHQLANPGRDCSANSWNLKLASWLQRDWQRLNRPKTPDEYRSARGFDLHPTPAGGHHAPRQRGYVMSATEAAIARGEQPKVPPGYVPPAGFAAPQPGAPVGNVYDADRG